MTPEQKEAKRQELRIQLAKVREDTLSFWYQLFREGEEFRKACGYSKGPDDMLQKLVKDYDAKVAKILKPLDSGELD